MTHDLDTQETITPSPIDKAIRLAQRMREEISKVLVGQDEVVEQLLITFLAGGHALIEGVPGLGKTLLVKALARTFNGDFSRIQFTPDLMPADVMGHSLLDMQTGQFSIRKGPVFCNLLLADEINRAPAKTQSALLEVMQEAQVTIEGQTQLLPPPFMVLATQNPIEQEGTYPLPEAQLDRFLLKISIDYPTAAEETQLVTLVTSGHIGGSLNVEKVQTLIQPEVILQLQKLVASLTVDAQVVDYAVRLVRATRDWPNITAGAGPRGGIALIRAGRAAALLAGRSFVTPDDIKQVAIPALRHRISLSPETEIEGESTQMVLSRILDKVAAPRL